MWHLCCNIDVETGTMIAVIAFRIAENATAGAPDGTITFNESGPVANVQLAC